MNPVTPTLQLARYQSRNATELYGSGRLNGHDRPTINRGLIRFATTNLRSARDVESGTKEFSEKDIPSK
jgi:hypothetical protein